MVMETALKPRYAPGEYPCTWLLPSGEVAKPHARVPGSITLEGSRIPEGHAYGPEISLESGPHGLTSFPQVSSYRVVRCELAVGAVATLVDAQVRVWAPGRVRISASCVLVGNRYPRSEDVAVCRARVQVTGIEAITATAPLERTVEMPRASDASPVSFTMTASPNARLEWEDNSANIVADYASRAALFDLYGTRHLFSPHLTIDLDEPVPFHDFSSAWIDSLHRLASVATGARQRITHLTVTGEDEDGRDGEWEVFARGITQQPFASSEEEVRETRSALALGRDGDSLLSLIRNWIRLDIERHPIIHSFGREMSTFEDQTPRAQFLTLVQAVEGTHRIENRERSVERETKHEAKRAALLASAGTSYLSSAERKFLTSNLSKTPPSGLDHALHWFAKTLPGDMASAAGSLTIVSEKLTDGSAQTWADAIRRIRNDYSHANRAYDPWELRELVVVLKRYVTSMCLRLIGAGDAAQARATDSDR